MKSIRNWGYFICLGMMVTGCIDLYTPQVATSATGYLVVDGVFNPGVGTTTTIKLSRTVPLDGSPEQAFVGGATVKVEGDDGSSYDYIDSGNGQYQNAGNNADPTKKYRLNIIVDQTQYVSDYVTVKLTPEIDSVHWTVANDQVEILVDTHDPSNSTRYYLWNYEETWRYHSAWRSTYKYVNGAIVPRDLSDDTYDCYMSAVNDHVNITSTSHLGSDVVHNYQIRNLPLESERLVALYSVLVSQYALTEDAFLYWQQVKNNSENLGTIFSPLPSQVISNIHSLNNANEPVVGYFMASTVKQKRKFISVNDIPFRVHTTYYQNCTADTLYPQYIPTWTGFNSYLIIEPEFKGIAFIGYSISTPECIDCTYHGGTTVKPSFFP